VDSIEHICKLCLIIMPIAASMGTTGVAVVPFIHQFIPGTTVPNNTAVGNNTINCGSAGTFFNPGPTRYAATNLLLSGSPGIISYSWSVSNGSVFAAFYSGYNNTGTSTVIVNTSSGSGSSTISVPIGTKSVYVTVSTGNNGSASFAMSLS